MAFRLRTVLEITDSILALVKSRSGVDDTEIGSVNRSLAEGSALQDGDQYVQIGKLKEAFSIFDAVGDDLDERLADYGTARLPATQALGQVVFGDSAAQVYETTLSAPASIGATTLTLTAAAGLAPAGKVVLDRGVSGSRELVTYTSLVGITLTLASPTTKAHLTGASVHRSVAGADRNFSVGTQVETEGDVVTQPLGFRTTEVATLLDGDAETSPVGIVSVGTGAIFNVASNVISKVKSPPFQTATVRNPDVTHGAREREKDEEAVSRVVLAIQSLPTGNVSALERAALNVKLPSGKRVESVQVHEEFIDPDVSLYIDDGNGTAEATEVLTDVNELLVFDAVAGRKRAKSSLWPMVSPTPQLKTSTQHEAFSVTGSPGAWVIDLDTSGGLTIGAHVGQYLIDANHVFHHITANTATLVTVDSDIEPALGPLNIMSVPLTIGVDAYLNETNGDIEVVAGLAAGAALVLQTVQRYTGLIEAVQRVVEGYGGVEPVKAAGVKVKVRAPQKQPVVFRIAISTDTMTPEATVQGAVKDAVVTYVNGLGIGQPVILAKVIDVVMSIAGITDCTIIEPFFNMAAGDGILNRTTASDVTVL